MNAPLLIASALIAAGEPAADGPADDLEQPTPSGKREIIVDFAPPGCLDSGDNHISMPAVLFENAAGSDYSARALTLGEGVLYDGTRWLFPRFDFSQGKSVRDLVASWPEWQRVVLHYGLPVVLSPNEVAFQYPVDTGRDRLREFDAHIGARRRFPNAQRTTMRLVQYTSPTGDRVLALEPLSLADGAPLNADLFDYVPEYGGLIGIDTPNGEDRLYHLGREIGRGSRILAELTAMGRTGVGRLVVHMGTVVRQYHRPERRALCAEGIAALSPSAMLPTDGELSLGPADLAEFAARHELPYVATNLAVAGGDGPKFPFPRYRIEVVDGLTVLFLALVGERDLAKLPAEIRDAWLAIPPNLALEESLAAAEEVLGRRPDLTMLLSSGPSDGVAGVRGIDVVLGSFPEADHRHFVQRTELRPRVEGISDGSRFEMAASVVRAGQEAVGRIRVEFEDRDAAPPRLAAIEVDSAAVLEDGPKDPVLEASIRAWEETRHIWASEIVLADPEQVIHGHPELEELVYGPRILNQDHYESYPRDYPAIFSDPLWMRLVVNSMLRALGAEVALSRNLPRSSTTVGKLQREYLDLWLRASDAIRLMELSGTQLLAIASAIERRQNSFESPRKVIFCAGLDAKEKVVRGRPITAERMYRVALTDAVVDLIDPEVLSLAGSTSVTAFSRGPEGLEPDPEAGESVLLRDLVVRVIEAGSAGRELYAQRAFLREMLKDHSSERDARWSLVLDEMSVRGSRYLNTGDLELFGQTRQTRLTTLDNTNFDLRHRSRLVYDAPLIAWDSRLRAELSQVVFDQQSGQERQEAADDLVATTELRFNGISATLGGVGGLPVTPFVQAVGDSEFTPTTDPVSGRTFPRQFLFRALAGAVAQPGPVLREVRLGAVFEQDLSSGSDQEWGVQTGYELLWPLEEWMDWESNLEARYFFPSSDDDASRLGLIVQWVNRLKVPVGGWFDFFAYVDLYAGRGKIPSTRDFAASWDLGAGIDVARLFYLGRSRAASRF